MDHRTERRIWWWQFVRKYRCPHTRLLGIYGDEINNVGGFRLYCLRCRRFIDGPVNLAILRASEPGSV